MKILLTVHQFVPEWSAGTEVLTFSTAKELIRRGHDVTVLTGFPVGENPPDDQRIDYYEIEGVPVYRYSHAMVPTKEQPVITRLEYKNHLAERLFDDLLKQLKPDVVHFFHFARLGSGIIDVALRHGVLAYYTSTDFWTICPTSQMLLPDFSMCTGPSCLAGNCIKHIFMSANHDTDRGNQSLLAKVPPMFADMIPVIVKIKHIIHHLVHGWISFILSTEPKPLDLEILALAKRHKVNVAAVNQLKRIFVPTQLVSSMLVANGVNKDVLRFTPYGIDVTGYDDVPLRTGTAKTIGFIGTLSEAKGCRVLVEAFKQLNHPDLRLKIYGNLEHYPNYTADLIALADNHPAIEFCGTFPNHEIVNVLSELDVLIVPSIWYENTPLVVYSALAAHCPVVASNLGGLSEAVRHQENGLLFTAGNSNELAETLRLLASTPDLLPRLSANCKPPKSTAQYVDELEAVYQQDLTQ